MKPTQPVSKVGNKVEFSSVSGTLPKFTRSRVGTIIDEVWTDAYQNNDFIWYIYTSQLVRWTDGTRSIRMTYYYKPAYSKRWTFGRFSPEDTPSIIQELIRKTLEKKWK
jgi:hypothetical protein